MKKLKLSKNTKDFARFIAWKRKYPKKFYQITSPDDLPHEDELILSLARKASLITNCIVRRTYFCGSLRDILRFIGLCKKLGMMILKMNHRSYVQSILRKGWMIVCLPEKSDIRTLTGQLQTALFYLFI